MLEESTFSKVLTDVESHAPIYSRALRGACDVVRKGRERASDVVGLTSIAVVGVHEVKAHVTIRTTIVVSTRAMKRNGLVDCYSYLLEAPRLVKELI